MFKFSIDEKICICIIFGIVSICRFCLKFSSRLYICSMIWRFDEGIVVEVPARWHTRTGGDVYPSDMCDKQSKVIHYCSSDIVLIFLKSRFMR
jgi:hypothetical protein